MCSFLGTLDLLKLDRGGHFLSVQVNLDDITEGAEESIDLYDTAVLLGHVLNVDRIAPRIHHVLRL